jgi:hypothetical protein
MPTDERACPVVDFDLFGAATRDASDDQLRSVRDTGCPVTWTEHNGGHWIVSSYDLVGEAFRDWDLVRFRSTVPGQHFQPELDGRSWTISGGDRSPLAGQVIEWTAKVSGSAAVGIDFNPNYAPAPPAARLIN